MAFRNADDYLRAQHPKLYNYCNPRVLTPAELLLPNAGEWVPATTALWTHQHLVGFTATPTGVLTYVGFTAIFRLGAVANVSVFKEDTVHMGMFIDDVLRLDTLQLFTTQTKTGAITETDLGELETGAVIDFRAMSEAGTQTLTVTSMKLTFR